MYKIIFHINFHTLWGQQLYVVGNLPEIGEWETAIAKPMTHVGNGDWVLEVSTETLPETLEYRYFVNADGRPLFQEWERNHTLRVDPSVFIYDLFDSWLVQPERIAFYSSAFTKGFWARPRRARSCPTGSGPRLILKVFAPCVTPGQELAIAGDCPELGEWQVERAPRLDDTAYPEWQINLDPTLAGRRFEYKFVIIDRATGQPVRWEAGDNRVCDLPAKGLAERVVLSGLTFREEAIEWRCAGTVVPLFSLRSEHDFGVGDFGDLHQLIDWAGATGQRVIQLLPVNDTTTTRTWTDSYPYSAISIYALHPLYIDTSSFRLDDPDRQAHYEAIRREFPRYARKQDRVAPKVTLVNGAPQVENQPSVTNHTFVSQDNKWKLNLTREFISLSTLAYGGWEEFAHRLDLPLAQFIRTYNPAFFQRLGLRYVNLFSRRDLGLEEEPWSELFTDPYLGILSQEDVREEATVKCSVDFDTALDGSCRARVHAGPGLIKANTPNVPQDKEVKFVLDLDLFMGGELAPAYAAGALETLHAHSTELFLGALTDKLYRAMEPR